MPSVLTVMGLSACTAKTNKANGRSSESHQARLNGRVVTDEGEANQEAGESTNETTKNEMTSLKGKKTLVAYFSWSGKEAGERPAIKGKVENMAQYDVVFVCVPVWWYTAPMPVFTFLEQYDLSGKTVIPFCTAYSGPSSTLRDIVSATPKSNHRDGICVVTKEMGGKDMEQKHPKIDKWLTEIGF